MSTLSDELWSVFDARRVKAPELRGLDIGWHALMGWFKNKRKRLGLLQDQSNRIEKLEQEIHELSSQRFAAEVADCRAEARLGKLVDEKLDRAMALAREAAWRGGGLRPFPCQIMGARTMCQGLVTEMATGEGKTLTASLAASIWTWAGRPVHVITVNDYLVARDAEEMAPVYRLLGVSVGHVVHETTQQDRLDHYRRDVIYMTSKELVADFL